jgi:hypothetical protein
VSITEASAAQPPAPANNTRGEARAGLALSVATFAMAAASAAQAVLYLSGYGTSELTDGFFIAFALYTTIGVFSQSLRLTAAPLLVEPGASLRPRELARALVIMALPVLLATGPLAGPLAALLAPVLSPEARAVTEQALPILGGAVALQLLAAGGATLLAVRSRFNMIAGAYIAGALAGLVAYGLLVDTAEELTLGWSMLTMAAVTFAVMMGAVARSGGFGEACRSHGPRAVASEAGLLLGRTVIYLAFNMLFVVSLAFVSRSAPGDATIFSYAYLFASYLVAGTATALGMSRIPEMTRKARAQQRATVRATVPVGFRYAMMLVAPAMLGLVAVGAPLVGDLFPASLDPAGVDALRVFGALLVPWTVAALLVNLLLPLMFAIGRATLVNALAIPLAIVHLAVSALASAVFGVDAVVLALCFAPGVFAVILVVAAAGPWAAGLGRELMLDAARFLLAATVAYGGALALADALADGFAMTLIAAVVGSAAYVVLLRLVAARQVTVVAQALRPSEA